MDATEAWAIAETVAKSAVTGLVVAGLGTWAAAWLASRHCKVVRTDHPYQDPISGETRLPGGER